MKELFSILHGKSQSVALSETESSESLSVYCKRTAEICEPNKIGFFTLWLVSHQSTSILEQKSFPY